MTEDNEETVAIRLGEDGPLRVRSGSVTFNRGETREVGRDHASALCEWYESFTVVDGADDGDSDDSEEVEVERYEDAIDDGRCPWCDEYEGGAVPQHASQTHPEEWREHKERGG